MPDFFKSIKITQPTPGGPMVEQVVGAVQTSTGTAADAGKIVVLNASGQIDPSMGGGSTVSVNAASVSNPNFNDTTPAAPGGFTNVIWNVSGSNVSAYYATSGTTVPFSQVLTGTNAGQTLTVGAGSTLTFTGTGIVNAREVGGIDVSGNAPTHAGQLLISQPGNTTAIWADPQVQGLYDTGSTISPAPAFVAPTNIQPVLIGGSDGTLLRNILTDSSGHLVVNVNGTVTTNIQASGTPLTATGSSLNVNITGGSSSNTQYTNGTAVASGSLVGTEAFGYDGTNVRALLTSGTGQLHVIADSGSTTAVTGTVSVTQGTSPWVVSLTSTTITGSVAVTQSTSPWVVGGSQTDNTANTTTKLATIPARANAASPAWTEGFQVPLSVDLSGNLRVNATGISGVQYTDPTTQASPTGTVAMGKNASNVIHALSLDGTGNLNVDTQAAVFAAANGSAVPADSVWLGASDGTNLQGLLTESVGNKNLRVAIFQGGNVANVSSNRLLVDPSGVTSPVSIAGTVLVSNTTQNYTQTSTTSGQIGPLVQGAVTTADPSYTTAQTSPLSLTTAGHLRSQDFATSSTGIAVPSKAMFIGGIGADGFLHGLSTDNAGILNVNASFSGTVTPGFVTDRVQSGAITSTQNVAVSTYGAASVIFNITGTWTGTIQFQSQLADNSWVTATVYPVFVGGASVTQTSTNGEWQIPVGGMQAFRVIGNTVGSGTATANLEAGAGAYSLFVQQLSASDLNATVVQGSAGTIAQSWFTKITDGSNVYGVTTAFPFFMQGTKTNNNAAPGANNVGVLPALANSSAPSYTDGDQVLLSVDTTGALRVSSSGTFTPALTADITATGTITNTQSVTLSTQGTGTTQFNITGSWTGTIVFEASVDGVNFVAAKALPRYPTAFPEVTSATANGQWAIATGGLSKFRLRGNSVASGTATIWLEGGAGAQDIQTLAMVFDPASGNVPAVKGSTTVPVAADNALVVALSPNSSQFATSTTATTLPGTNPQTIGTSSSAVVNATASRKEITITNTGTTVIFLGLGQTPTITSYHIALSGCTLANDGTGSTYTTDIWKGAINAISSSAGGLVNVAELT